MADPGFPGRGRGCWQQTWGYQPETYYYRPQRSWAKVIFSQACVKNSVHRGGRVSASLHAGIPPRTRQTPPDQADPLRPGRHPPPDQADHPGPGRHPPRPGRHPLQTRQTPPRDQAAPLPSTRQTPAYEHTVYERPVRILLECILVWQKFLLKATRKWKKLDPPWVRQWSILIWSNAKLNTLEIETRVKEYL